MTLNGVNAKAPIVIAEISANSAELVRPSICCAVRWLIRRQNRIVVGRCDRSPYILTPEAFRNFDPCLQEFLIPPEFLCVRQQPAENSLAVAQPSQWPDVQQKLIVLRSAAQVLKPGRTGFPLASRTE